ncbi:MAG: C25 family cysteine peptidase, partial [bacterium]
SGPQIPEDEVPPGVVSADTATATFPVEKYFEEDNVFFEGTPPARLEFFFYDYENRPTVQVPFPVGAIDPAGTFRLRAGFQGGDRARSDRNVKISIVNSITTTALDPALVPNKQFVEYQSPVLGAGVIAPGQNTLRIDKTSDRTTLEALLDWFTIEYRSFYRAKGNVIEFNTGTLAGDTSLTVTGLSRTDVMLFDVTDPLSPREVHLNPGHFTDVDGGYVVSIRESLTSRRQFVLAPFDHIDEIPADDIIRDNPSSLIGSAAEGGVDVLVVCHGDFTDEMGEWTRYRRAQGYRVLMADVEDIYDEFGGGVPSALAVKNFIRHFFETGGASFVVLVGDASEDNKRVNIKSGINFVPTESFSEYAGGSFNKDEVVTTDKWYVTLDCDFIDGDPPCTDYFPDVILGRLPVGSAAEAQIVVDKILAFEEPTGEDFWRRRIIRVADNAFSGAGYLCYVSSEEDFKTAEESAAQIFESAIPGGFDVVPVYLGDRIEEPPHTPGSCELASVLTTRTRSTVTPALIGELNKGATFVSIQAHMNRYLVAHEWLLTSSSASPDGLKDYTRMANTGRPWVLFGMGCHLTDYAPYMELAQTQLNGPNGDSFGELLLFRPNAGAVATYASTGYEYLYPNKNFTPLIAEANFENVPTDTMVASHKAQARWILGELMAVAEIENLTRYLYVGSGGGAMGQMKRYHLLGDPVLRIDGGPPRFDVTVNDDPFQSGDVVPSGTGSMHVRAVVT